MRFIETTIFTKQLKSILSDEDYRLLQNVLVLRPDSGKIITGSGGLRKARWSSSGRGKRGGCRFIYYWAKESGTVLMLFIYPKNVQDNLSADQLNKLKKIVESEFNER